MSNNILKTLFVDCADAIRETLPDIGKISPNAFPDNIRAVAKAGGGGSDIEETIYWKYMELLPTTVKGYYRPFVYNDTLHFMYHASAKAPIIYTYIDGVLTELFTADIFTNYSTLYAGILEYNGKLHIIGGESRKHGVWDGNVFTTMSENTESTMDGAFVHCNKIYSHKYGKLYLYDDDSDTWSLVKQLSTTVMKVYPINDEKSLILLLDGIIYEMSSDLTLTAITEDEVNSGSQIIYHNDTVYSLYARGYGDGCFKFVNGEKVQLPDPHQGLHHNFLLYQNSIHMISGIDASMMYRKHCVLVDNT